MMDDTELLRRYAESRSEEAFAELVRRRIGLVYSVALRHTRDVHRAEDVTQAVFAALARKADQLARRPVLVGWLHRSAQFAASDAVRVESRRQAREQEAHTMDEIEREAPEPNWEKLRPVLDEALNEMDESDRDAVLLRFFDSRPFSEIGAKLRLSENAARMRVERALDKLHAALERRGITSTATALGLALANQAGVAAPAGLAASVAGMALAGASAAGAGAGAIAFMSTGKMMLGLAGAAAIAGFGVAVVASGGEREAAAALATATTRQTALSAKLTELENRVQAETLRGQRAEDENARLLLGAQKMNVARPRTMAVAEAPVTSDVVRARFKWARELARTGDPAEALRELLWCFDVGMVRAPSMSATRFSDGVDALADLAVRYPPARDALLERREKARKTIMADEQEIEAAWAFGAINRVLKDGAATVAVFDQLRPGDPRRQVLAMQAHDDLVAARRYAEALESRPYAVVSSLFERNMVERPRPSDPTNSEEASRKNRDIMIAETASSIEALAGTGDLVRARALAERLLALDGSASTRAILQQRLTRAGRPDLLTAPVR